jgi:hypothetical protein
MADHGTRTRMTSALRAAEDGSTLYWGVISG